MISGSAVSRFSKFAFFCLLRRRQVRDLTALDHSRAAGLGADRAQRDTSPGRDGVLLQVPVGGVHRLPDAAQVRLAIGQSRDASLAARPTTENSAMKAMVAIRMRFPVPVEELPECSLQSQASNAIKRPVTIKPAHNSSERTAASLACRVRPSSSCLGYRYTDRAKDQRMHAHQGEERIFIQNDGLR